MDIVVLIKFVPDLVEELEIDDDTGLLDRSFLRLMPNELDEHALEQALILKERHGGSVTVLTLDTGDVDETLFTAIAKGADRVIKITGDNFEEGVSNHRQAAIFNTLLANIPHHLILTGTQAVDDLDGFLGALLAQHRQIPYIGYVTKIIADNQQITAQKEYPGGLNAEITSTLPAVLGIQAAEQPPRYIVTSKVMDAMKSATIEEIEAPDITSTGETPVTSMALPQAGEHAEMLTGDVADVAQQLVNLLKTRGVLA